MQWSNTNRLSICKFMFYSWGIAGKPHKDSSRPFSPIFPLHVITISLSRLSTSHWVIVSSLPAHSGHPTTDFQQKKRRHPLQQNNLLGVLEESNPLHAPAYLFGTGRLSSSQSFNCNWPPLHQKCHLQLGESLLCSCALTEEREHYYLTYSAPHACSISLEYYQLSYQW